jgi:valyl-tRNA synthetase
LVEEVIEYRHAVGHCYRCDTAIEPWASEQWFVRMPKLAQPAIDAVRDGRVRFNPERWQKVYFQWMENIRDWCISRQLWWGHRIPVFYCDECGWHDASVDQIEACPDCGEALRQDEDVLDTWFSSQLWPFATYGWPDDPDAMAELEANYPTQVLSTARDIIFLWVARMIISSMYFLDGTVPFFDVNIHPTVLDRFGNIMSKSRGNGIDPMDLIGEFGADVMRFGLAAQCTGSQDLKFDKDKLAVYRNFATKIHNAARFVFLSLEDGYRPQGRVTPKPMTLADRWILSRLARLAAQLDDGQSTFEFGLQTRALYGFFWNEFCDWYIEFAKVQMAVDGETRGATLDNLLFVLDNALRLLHPIMPFLTESIWLELPHGDDRPSLTVAAYPDAQSLAACIDLEAERSMQLLINVVGALRSTRARYQISPRTQLAVAVKATGADAEADVALLGGLRLQIASMANCEDMVIGADLAKPAASVLTIADGLEVYVVLAGLVDLEAERARLDKALANRQKDALRLEAKLANPGFMAKADADVIEHTRDELERLEGEMQGLADQISGLA